MLLLLEIALTVSAYRKGWKGLAFLPGGLCLMIAFLIGAALAANGQTVQDATPVLLLGDVIAVVALAVMSARAPQAREIARPALGRSIEA